VGGGRVCLAHDRTSRGGGGGLSWWSESLPLSDRRRQARNIVCRWRLLCGRWCVTCRAVVTWVSPGRRSSTQLSDMSLKAVLRRIGHGDITSHGLCSPFRTGVWKRSAIPFRGRYASARLRTVFPTELKPRTGVAICSKSASCRCARGPTSMMP